MAHPHAKAMAQYAQDAMETIAPWERWERKIAGISPDWEPLVAHPNWETGVLFRRKPYRTIGINKYKVPEPIRNAPEKYMAYWAVDFRKCGAVECYSWTFADEDMACLNNGVVHLTREAAELHAEALLSFTKDPNYGTDK